MEKKYFSLDEDFEKIIKNALKNKEIKSINQISTGWTNIVFEVNTNDGNYFFRFPRDDFWSKTIVKDCEFSKYIHNKTDYNTVQLNLLYDNNRPFSMHKKIEGTVLSDKMDDLSKEQIEELSKEIADFMFQLHNVKFDRNDIFETKNIGLNLVDFLDELLNVHVNPEDKVFWKYDEFAKKDNNCLVHGDLNSGNIILDENNHIAAIIDLGFAGFGNKYFDIARIIGRCPKSFREEIVKNYELLEQKKLDYEVLDNEIDIWANIDKGYINYMRGIGIYQ